MKRERVLLLFLALASSPAFAQRTTVDDSKGFIVPFLAAEAGGGWDSLRRPVSFAGVKLGAPGLAPPTSTCSTTGSADKTASPSKGRACFHSSGFRLFARPMTIYFSSCLRSRAWATGRATVLLEVMPAQRPSFFWAAGGQKMAVRRPISNSSVASRSTLRSAETIASLSA